MPKVDKEESLTSNKEIVYKIDKFDAHTKKIALPGEFRVGLATSDCPSVLFDSFKMGPIELMKATEIQSSKSLIESAASKFGTMSNKPLITWQPCADASTFLERQLLCKNMFGSDATAAGRCSSNFCFNCKNFVFIF